jgi:hypothetical protein
LRAAICERDARSTVTTPARRAGCDDGEGVTMGGVSAFYREEREEQARAVCVKRSIVILNNSTPL